MQLLFTTFLLNTDGGWGSPGKRHSKRNNKLTYPLCLHNILRAKGQVQSYEYQFSKDGR